MSWWSWAWIAWLGIFLALEIPAIANTEKGDTLSETVWRWFSVRHEGRLWPVRRGALWAFMTWLFLHILTGC